MEVEYLTYKDVREILMEEIKPLKDDLKNIYEEQKKTSDAILSLKLNGRLKVSLYGAIGSAVPIAVTIVIGLMTGRL